MKNKRYIIIATIVTSCWFAFKDIILPEAWLASSVIAVVDKILLVALFGPIVFELVKMMWTGRKA